MSATNPQVFIFHAGEDAFEAGILKFAVETLLRDKNVVAWTYQRNQNQSERNVAAALKQRVRESCATVFLVSLSALDGGATQWMELAYADAFEVSTFVLLHHLEYSNLQRHDAGVLPLLLAGQCSSATKWREAIDGIRHAIEGEAE